MQQGARRRLNRQRRRRIDILHRAQSARQDSTLTSGEPCGPGAPFTIDQHIREEMDRRGRSSAPPPVYGRAKDLATWAAQRDPSPQVCAAFGVERALDGSSRGVGLDHRTPDCFVGTQPYYSKYDPVMNKLVFHEDKWDGGLTEQDQHSVRSIFLRFDFLPDGIGIPGMEEWDDGSADLELSRVHSVPQKETPDDGLTNPDASSIEPEFDKEWADRLADLGLPGLQSIFEQVGLNEEMATSGPRRVLSHPRDAKVAPEDGIISATWCPKYPRASHTADVIRPPAEALALASLVLQQPATLSLWGPEQLPAILGIGLGHGTSAQLLSAMLPNTRVYQLATPYQVEPALPLPYQAVVLNVPDSHPWAIARLLGNPARYSYLERRRILRGGGRLEGDQQHVQYLVRLAEEHRHPGRPLVLMGDPGAYQAAMEILLTEQGVTPMKVAGLDTSERGIWVDYANQAPWAPHGLPRPTGKVVGFWRWP